MDGRTDGWMDSSVLGTEHPRLVRQDRKAAGPAARPGLDAAVGAARVIPPGGLGETFIPWFGANPWARGGSGAASCPSQPLGPRQQRGHGRIPPPQTPFPGGAVTRPALPSPSAPNPRLQGVPRAHPAPNPQLRGVPWPHPTLPSGSRGSRGPLPPQTLAHRGSCGPISPQPPGSRGSLGPILPQTPSPGGPVGPSHPIPRLQGVHGPIPPQTPCPRGSRGPNPPPSLGGPMAPSHPNPWLRGVPWPLRAPSALPR